MKLALILLMPLFYTENKKIEEPYRKWNLLSYNYPLVAEFKQFKQNEVWLRDEQLKYHILHHSELSPEDLQWMQNYLRQKVRQRRKEQIARVNAARRTLKQAYPIQRDYRVVDRFTPSLRSIQMQRAWMLNRNRGFCQ